MSESEKLISQDVIYICNPLRFNAETQENSFFDSLKESAGGIVDKVMPESTVGKVAVGGGLAAIAFAAIPAGIVGTLAAGGIAAGVAGVNALLGKAEKENPDKQTDIQNSYTAVQILDFAKKQFKNDGKINLDDIAVVPCDIAKNVFDADSIRLKNVKRLINGVVLIRHPFLPDTYIDIDSTEKELFHKKQLCISSVMQYLGAKAVKGHAKVVESKRRLIDSRGKVSYENVKVNASVLSEQNQHYEAEYKIADTFPEEYSPSDYKLAIEEAAKFGLDKDDDIKSLIEQRNPEKPRPIKSRHVSIEMSRELNNVLDTAISLEAVGAELDGGYKEILETSKRVLFELEIEF